MQDPVSDLLTNIRNGYLAKKEYIIVFSSKLKVQITELLKKECFLNDYTLIEQETKKKHSSIYN